MYSSGPLPGNRLHSCAAAAGRRLPAAEVGGTFTRTVGPLSWMRMAIDSLLGWLAHPDDEVGLAGAILAQRARGDRVVVVWFTRGEMTEAFGPLPAVDVAAIREEHGRRAGEILGVET